MIALARTDGSGFCKDPERLIKVLGIIASRFPYLIPKLRKLHDHKGTLVVVSGIPLTQAEQDLIGLVWSECFHEACVSFHVRGEREDDSQLTWWYGDFTLAPDLPEAEHVDGYLRLLSACTEPQE